VEGGIIKDAAAYSDGMETAYIQAIGEALKDIPFTSKEINRSLLSLANRVPVPEEMLMDITHLI
jgi:hypothetical protein